jgi:hypothetical protein
VQDPMVENAHYDYSPYAYVYNNPIKLLDYFGLDSIDAVALAEAQENAVEYVEDNYGSTSAQCSRGVKHAFKELTGSEIFDGMKANETHQSAF